MSDRLSSPRFVRRVTWIAALIFISGVIAFAVAWVGGRDDESAKQAAPSASAAAVPNPSRASQREQTVPVSDDAKQVAADFILSAVTREDLVKAWQITDPESEIRMCGGKPCTYKEWLGGEIPVQPFPPDQLQTVTYKVDESYADRVVLQVVLLPKEGAQLEQQIFFIGLKAVGNGKQRRWLVDYWAPRAVIPVPAVGDG